MGLVITDLRTWQRFLKISCHCLTGSQATQSSPGLEESTKQISERIQE